MCDRWLLRLLLLLLLDGAHGDGGVGRRRGEAELLVNLRLREEPEPRREIRVRPPEVVQAHGAGLAQLKELTRGGGTEGGRYGNVVRRRCMSGIVAAERGRLYAVCGTARNLRCPLAGTIKYAWMDLVDDKNRATDDKNRVTEEARSDIAVLRVVATVTACPTQNTCYRQTASRSPAAQKPTPLSTLPTTHNSLRNLSPSLYRTCWSSSCFIRELIIAWMSGGATGAATAGTGGSGGGGRGAAGAAGAATGACATGGGYGTAAVTAGGGGSGSGGAAGNGGCTVVTAAADANVAGVDVAIGEEEEAAAAAVVEDEDEDEAVDWLLRICL